MRLKTFLPGLQTSVFSVVAQSWADVADGLSEGATVVHDGQRVRERVEGGKEEGKAHPSGENILKFVNIQHWAFIDGDIFGTAQ